jgi:cobalt-zinc-cadmium efflux system outer membrane protein
VRRERERLRSARARTESFRERLLPLRVTILDQTLRHYNMMLLGAYDVLAARRAELESEKEYVESWRDYWVARVRLERAVGSALGAVRPPRPESPGGER